MPLYHIDMNPPDLYEKKSFVNLWMYDELKTDEY